MGRDGTVAYYSALEGDPPAKLLRSDNADIHPPWVALPAARYEALQAERDRLQAALAIAFPYVVSHPQHGEDRDQALALLRLALRDGAERIAAKEAKP